MNNEKYDRAIEKLKQHQIRITPQRQIILDYMVNSDQHPTVENIYQALNKKFSNLSMATIYNNLNLLRDLDIIIEIPNPEGGYRYDFFETPHIHAICDNCGKIFDIDFPKYNEFNQEIKKAVAKYNFAPKKSHIEVNGLCENCQQKRPN